MCSAFIRFDCCCSALVKICVWTRMSWPEILFNTAGILDINHQRKPLIFWLSFSCLCHNAGTIMKKKARTACIKDSASLAYNGDNQCSKVTMEWVLTIKDEVFEERVLLGGGVFCKESFLAQTCEHWERVILLVKGFSIHICIKYKSHSLPSRTYSQKWITHLKPFSMWVSKQLYKNQANSLPLYWNAERKPTFFCLPRAKNVLAFFTVPCIMP